MPLLSRLEPERRMQTKLKYRLLYVVANQDCRYGEMTVEEKEKISHRARALAKLRTYLGSL
jgi:inosine/xanthosine triphosphate pyrophosphatase family protein